MKSPLRIAAALASLSVVFGCGGGAKLAPGKDNAASAVFMTSQGANSTPHSIYRLAQENIGGGLDVTVSCQHGGNVTIHYTVNVSPGSTGLSFDLRYSGCNYDGKTSLDGTMSVTESVVTGASTASVSLQLSGRVNFSGAISDFVSADVTEQVATGDLNGVTSASITLNGTVSDSSGTYTYNNETISVSDIQAANH